MVFERPWYEDPLATFGHPRWLRFVPTSDLGVAGQLNAALRLAVYFAALMFVFSRSARYALVVPVVAGLTYLAGRHADAGARAEGFPRGAGACTPPTTENPYMNFMHGADDPNRTPACPLPLSGAASEQRAGSVPHDGANERSVHRFYTMPVTEAAADQDRYARSLYGNMPGKPGGGGV